MPRYRGGGSVTNPTTGTTVNAGDTGEVVTEIQSQIADETGSVPDATSETTQTVIDAVTEQQVGSDGSGGSDTSANEPEDIYTTQEGSSDGSGALDGLGTLALGAAAVGLLVILG